MTLHAIRTFFTTPSLKLGVVISILTGAFFGLGPPLSQQVYADGGNFVFVAILMMFCRGFLLVLYCTHKKLQLFASRDTLKITASGALFHSFGMTAFFGAVALLPGPLASIILYIFPLGLLVFLVWRGEATLTALSVLLVLTALAGLSLVLHVWDVHVAIDWRGVVLALLAAVFVGGRMYLHGKQLEHRSPYVVGAENFILGLVFTSFLAFWKLPTFPQTGEGYMWAALLGLAFSLGSLWTFTGMAMTGSFIWSLTGKVEPVYAAVFSAVFFHDYLTTEQYIGAAILLTSLVLYQFSSRPQTVVMPKG